MVFGHLFSGRVEQWLEINAELASVPGLSHLFGVCALAFGYAFRGTVPS